MKSSKYIYSGFVFLIIISSAIAFNKNKQPSKSIIVDLTVDFNFNNNNVCSGQSVSFTSSVTGDGPFEYAWDFGDLSTSSQQNPSHNFIASGCFDREFNVKLTVTDKNGIIQSKTKTIIVKPKPEISFFDINPGAAGQFDNCGNPNPSSQFLVNVGNDSSSSSCINSYNISWGDGTNASNVSFPISHNYVGYGTYDMKITAIGKNGCTTTTSYQVRNATNPSGGISGPGDTQNLCTPSKDIQFEITNWGRNTSDTTY